MKGGHSGVCYWVAANTLPIFAKRQLLYPCAPKTMALPMAAICCEDGKDRKGQQEPAELIPVWASVLWVECDLGTKRETQKQRHCWLGILLAVDVTRGITFIDRLLGTSHLYTFFLIHKQNNHLKLILWIRKLTSKVFWYIQDHTMVRSRCRIGKEVCLLQSWPFRNWARTGSNGRQGKGRCYGAETLLTFPSPPQFSHPNVNFPNTNLNDPTEKIWKGKAVWVEGYGNQRS